MERRKFIHTAAMSSLGLMTLGGSSCALLKIQKEISFGHGTHKYRVKNDWSWASFSRYPIKDAHEMVQVKDGRFFLLTNETRNNIIIFDESGQLIDTWGDSFPGGHGLTLSDEGGEEFLYITDHDLHKVFKTDLKGNVVLTLEAPLDSDSYSSKDVFKPTETTISSDGSIYVADGYGAQWITVFNQDGTIKNQF
ncbi:MAG: 6-bladed beta-propeller, partial [Crocinitomicaceae bacterium]